VVGSGVLAGPATALKLFAQLWLPGNGDVCLGWFGKCALVCRSLVGGHAMRSYWKVVAVCHVLSVDVMRC
jgi:hypothetical protein